MNIMELGAIGELVGGVAVIASLLYVGHQVRHNTRAVASGTHGDMLQFSSGIERLIIDNAEMAEIEHRGSSRPDDLLELEWKRFASFASLRFAVSEAAYLNHRKALIDEEMRSAWDSFWRAALEAPGYRRAWSEAAVGFAPTFQRYIHRQVATT